MSVRATDAAVAEAADALAQGRLVIFPTETVYGLGADATNAKAVAAIYAAKGRPAFNPLISHVPDLKAAEAHAQFNPRARALARAFWPGPLTLVLKRRDDSSVAELACAGLSTIALRAPAHPVAQRLLARFGNPIAAPSANRSGRLSPTIAAHAEDDVGDTAAITLDGGASEAGLESSIVAIDDDGGATLLRPGAIVRADLEAVLGPLSAPTDGAVAAPGMLASHYAPRARLRLDAATPHAGEAYLAFGANAPADALNLSPDGDLAEAAANLYAYLRALDAAGPDIIAVAPLPRQGLGEAIRDRLARAAAPR